VRDGKKKRPAYACWPPIAAALRHYALNPEKCFAALGFKEFA